MMNLINTLKDKKNRRLAISLGVIVVLVLFLVVSSRDKKSGEIPRVKSFDSADEVLFLKSNKKIRLFKKDNKWMVNELAYPADQSKAEYLVKQMKDLDITDFITKEPYLSKYELDAEKAVRVTVKDKGIVQRDIFIGKASSTYRSAYVKFEKDPRVFLAEGNLSIDFNKEVDDLRDKQIYKFGRDEIVSFELLYNGKLTFEKKIEEVEEKSDAKEAKNTQDKDKQKEKKKVKVESWICREYRNTAIDKNKVDNFANGFSSIVADIYPIAIEKKDVKGAICSIKTKVNNKEIDFVIHKKDKDKYLCTSSESPYVFALNEDNVKKFFKGLADFKQDAPPAKQSALPQPVKK